MVKKVTMQQIADHLGVSKFVVSKALSGKNGVSASTRERVIQTASQLGYFVNKGSYQLASKSPQVQNMDAYTKNRSVVVLMPNIRFQTKESSYWGRILEGISAELEKQGIGMVIITEQSTEQFLNILNPQGFLGVIGVGLIQTALLLEIRNLGIPLVLIDHEDPLIPSDNVFVNNQECIVRLTNHLMGLGHTNMHFIGNIKFARSFFDRWVGYRVTMEDHQMPVELHDEMLKLEGYDREQHTAEIKAWLERKAELSAMPTALVCANDAIAISAMTALNELGRSVPDDVSVTGFDNIEDSYRHTPGLTTVNVPKEVLGRRAVETLLWRLEYPSDPQQKLLVYGDIIIRDSVQALAERKVRA
jgi:LacI family transcriptional regulator